jgi:hypothetical protein
MSTELSTEISPEIINSLILTGDMSKLTPAQQTQYYHAVCKDLGLNPLTQPFAIFSMQGKKVMYATKGCTQQLANIRKIDTEVLSREVKDSVYIVSVRATMPDGRKTDEDGIVGIVGLKGTDLANAMLKAITKAKRRAVLALCGLNMSDESEVEDIKGARVEPEINKSKIENIIEAKLEPTAVAVPEPPQPGVQQDAPQTPEKVKKDKPQAEEKTKDMGKKHPTDDGKSTKKVRQRDNEINGQENQAIPTGHKTLQGIIKEIPPVIGIGEPPKPKWVYTMGEAKLGTFDASIANALNEIIKLQQDKPILLNIEYKERETASGKVVKDIVSFKQVVADKNGKVLI